MPKKKIKVTPKKREYDFTNVPEQRKKQPTKAKPVTDNQSNQAKTKLENLLRETGTIADRKTEIKHPSGNTVEKEVIQKANPEPQKTEPQQQQTQQQKPQTNSDNDAVAAMLNSAGMLIGAKKFNKVPQACAMTPEEIASIHDLQPEGGLQSKSWIIYVLAAASMITTKIMNAPSRTPEKDVSMDDLISTMEKQGYKIQRPERDLNPLITELQKNGYTISKNGVQEANVIK